MMKTFATIACLLLLAAIFPVHAQDEIDRLDMKAHAAFSAHDYDTAIEIWSAVIKLDPKDSTAWYNRGTAYACSKQSEKALADFTEAIRLDPADPQARASRAELYGERLYAANKAGDLDMDDAGRMIADYNEIIRLNPQSKTGYQLLSGFDRQYYRQAIEYWSAVLKNHPENARAWYNRAEAYAGGKFPDKAIADYVEAIRLEPANRDFYDGRSSAYRDKRDNAKADADHAESVRLLFLQHEPVTEQWAREQAAQAEDRYDPALGAAAWSAIVKFTPNDPVAWLNLGWGDSGANPDKAIADYTEAIRLNPKYDRAYYFRAGLYVRKKDKAKAVADYTEAIKLDPGKDYYYVVLADLYNNFRDWDDVIANCTGALGVNPKNEDALMLRNGALKARGFYERALENDKEYMAGVPNSPEGYVLAAWIYAACPDPKLRDGAEAMKLAQKSSDLAKGDFCEAVAALAAGEADCGKWDDAIKHIKQAMDMMKGISGTGKRAGEYADQLAHYEQKQTYTEKAGEP